MDMKQIGILGFLDGVFRNRRFIDESNHLIDGSGFGHEFPLRSDWTYMASLWQQKREVYRSAKFEAL